jgi:hypothetical protein
MGQITLWNRRPQYGDRLLPQFEDWAYFAEGGRRYWATRFGERVLGINIVPVSGTYVVELIEIDPEDEWTGCNCFTDPYQAANFELANCMAAELRENLPGYVMQRDL